MCEQNYAVRFDQQALPINERAKLEKQEDGQDMPINLAHGLFLKDRVDRKLIVVLFDTGCLELLDVVDLAARIL